MTNSTPNSSTNLIWPALPVAAWQDTYETLHLWTQIIFDFVNHQLQIEKSDGTNKSIALAPRLEELVSDRISKN